MGWRLRQGGRGRENRRMRGWRSLQLKQERKKNREKHSQERGSIQSSKIQTTAGPCWERQNTQDFQRHQHWESQMMRQHQAAKTSLKGCNFWCLWILPANFLSSSRFSFSSSLFCMTLPLSIHFIFTVNRNIIITAITVITTTVGPLTKDCPDHRPSLHQDLVFVVKPFPAYFHARELLMEEPPPPFFFFKITFLSFYYFRVVWKEGFHCNL